MSFKPLKPDEFVDKSSNVSKLPPSVEEVEVHGDVQHGLHHQHGEHRELPNNCRNGQCIVRMAQTQKVVLVVSAL